MVLQKNPKVGNFNQPLLKTIRVATTENRKLQQEIQHFLLQYRSTPHPTTEVSPAELLFNRPIRRKLPSIIVSKYQIANENMEPKKENYKKYKDPRPGLQPNLLKEGDTVLLKQEEKNKLTTPFNSQPYTLNEINGPQVIAKSSDGHVIQRNTFHFKRNDWESNDNDDTNDTRGNDTNEILLFKEISLKIGFIS